MHGLSGLGRSRMMTPAEAKSLRTELLKLSMWKIRGGGDHLNKIGVGSIGGNGWRGVEW